MRSLLQISMIMMADNAFRVGLRLMDNSVKTAFFQADVRLLYRQRNIFSSSELGAKMAAPNFGKKKKSIKNQQPTICEIEHHTMSLQHMYTTIWLKSVHH